MKMSEEYTTFDSWFKEKGFDEQHRGILAKAWNGGVCAACEYFGEMEGTTYDAEEKFIE